jgi:hypothetical protein
MIPTDRSEKRVRPLVTSNRCVATAEDAVDHQCSFNSSIRRDLSVQFIHVTCGGQRSEISPFQFDGDVHHTRRSHLTSDLNEQLITEFNFASGKISIFSGIGRNNGDQMKSCGTNPVTGCCDQRVEQSYNERMCDGL